MPRGSVDYQKGLIYTIRTGDSVYVGSTTDFRRRKSHHKSNIKNGYQTKIYQVIRENNFEWDMKPYKLFPCNSKMDLEIEEERIRREINADLNTIGCRAIEKKKRDTSLYYSINKNKILQQRKEYREKNREAIRKKKNEAIICQCGCSISRRNLYKHKKTKKHQDFMLFNNTDD